MADDYGYDSYPDAGYNEEDDADISFEGSISPDGHKFRPTLADDLKVGFFSLDRATQTEESEIVHLKEMTDVVQELLKDAAEMKRDINFARHVMNADFEAKLKQKSIDLYCRVNERIAELEKIHEERTATVRRAFKQQLSDAIARMHTYYMKDMEARLGKDAMAKHGESAKWDAKFKEMTATIQRNESIIHMLKAQVEQYQRQAEDAERSARAAHLAAEAVEVEQVPIEEPRPPSRTESTIAEIDNLKDEISSLEKKTTKLEGWLEEKKTKIAMLNGEIQSLLDQLERERVMVQQMSGTCSDDVLLWKQQLRHEKEEMLSDSANDKSSSQRMMESQRLAMEKEMEEKVQHAIEKALNDGKEEAARLQAIEQGKYARLQEEKLALEQRLAKVMSKAGEKTKEAIDLEKAKRSESRLMTEVSRLKKEIEKVHKTWEKKFTILQQSLHALKDESYLRTTMQRQAAQLHQASISYAPFSRYEYDLPMQQSSYLYDMPMGISPNRPPVQPPSKRAPLPDISKGRKSPDAISYTVSAVSGRNTAVFTPFDEKCESKPPANVTAGELENQVMSDGEQDLPPEFVPLPGPPSRSQMDCGEESRPSTRSHVVVLPSAEVQ